MLLGSRVLAALVSACLVGCAVTHQLLAAPGDLEDYRAFRMAKREGARLARAQAYLERHPEGAWASEVRTVFDAEEASWFEAAKGSRARARDYVVDLPRGPHIEAARALLLLFDERQDDIDTLELLAEARRTQSLLDEEAERRRRLGEVVLAEVAALLDPATWGARLDEPPPLLGAVLRGPVSRSWGGEPVGVREDRAFFVVPTPDGMQARAVDVRFQLVVSHGRLVQGMITGEDLFVRWAEALAIRVLDPTAPADREAAAAAVADVLAGALEGRMPAERCAAAVAAGRGPETERELLARGCDGWGASVLMGANAGEVDVIAVRGPQVARASDGGMR
ncbi:MAG TPA: hypothetical protein VKU41_23830 [Polyangiaceae bacterium]|nr:hypothetical protein [Polyangiaceae bacterium]